MLLEKVLLQYYQKLYPFSREKIIKLGYNVPEFLKKIKREIEEADDYKEHKNDKNLKGFLKAVEKLKKV